MEIDEEQLKKALEKSKRKINRLKRTERPDIEDLNLPEETEEYEEEETDEEDEDVEEETDVSDGEELKSNNTKEQPKSNNTSKEIKELQKEVEHLTKTLAVSERIEEEKNYISDDKNFRYELLLSLKNLTSAILLLKNDTNKTNTSKKD